MLTLQGVYDALETANGDAPPGGGGQLPNTDIRMWLYTPNDVEETWDNP